MRKPNLVYLEERWVPFSYQVPRGSSPFTTSTRLGWLQQFHPHFAAGLSIDSISILTADLRSYLNTVVIGALPQVLMVLFALRQDTNPLK